MIAEYVPFGQGKQSAKLSALIFSEYVPTGHKVQSVEATPE